MRIFKNVENKNIITLLKEENSNLGSEFVELIPGVTDGAREKHVPAVEVNGSNVIVKIGEVIHPMLENHYIEFIILETKKGVYIKYLKPNMEPIVSFIISDDEEIISVYEYCNLHGLWKCEL